MSLGRHPATPTETRDIEADILAAQVAEYESYFTAGDTERAEAVAIELRAKGHVVPGQKERAVPEPLEKAVEGDVSPKRRPGRPRKATAPAESSSTASADDSAPAE